MRVIAFDPGYERLGVALLEKNSGKDVVLFSTTVRTNKEDDFPTRLAVLASAVESFINTHTPTHCAMEKLFFQKNQKTAMKVAEVRGMLLHIAKRHNLIIEEYSPQEVKIAITGEGRSDKRSMMRLLPKLVSLPRTDMLDDEYDAIAIGITSLAYYREKR
jgi:crossover junction endodeoxyribonuclease RuvC